MYGATANRIPTGTRELDDRAPSDGTDGPLRLQACPAAAAAPVYRAASAVPGAASRVAGGRVRSSLLTTVAVTMDAQLEAAAALPASGDAQPAAPLVGALKRKSQSSAKVVPLDAVVASPDVETGTAAALTDAKVCEALRGTCVRMGAACTCCLGKAEVSSPVHLPQLSLSPVDSLSSWSPFYRRLRRAPTWRQARQAGCRQRQPRPLVRARATPPPPPNVTPTFL